MLTMFKYAKNQIIHVIMIAILVILDMIVILKIPEYTANIINVGIQQSGISQVLPTAVRKDSLETLTNFMTNNDAKIVKKYYNLTSIDNISSEKKEDFIKKYPEIQKEALYIFTSSSKGNILKELSEIFTNAIITEQIIKNNSSEIFDNVTQKLLSKNGNVSTIETFKSLQPSVKNQIKFAIKEHLNKITDTEKYQLSINFIKEEYESIGIDLTAMQMECILNSFFRILFLTILSFLVNIMIIFASAKISAELAQHLRNLIYNKVLKFSGKEMDEFSSSTLITRTTSDVQQIQLFMPIFLRFFFSLPFSTLFVCIKIMQADLGLLGIMICCIGVILALTFITLFIVSPKYKLIQQKLDKLNIIARETLNGILTIRALCRQKYQTKKFKKTNKNFFELNVFVNKITSCLMPTLFFIMNLSCALILYVSSDQIAQGSLQIGNIMIIIQYAMQLIVAFIILSMLLYSYPRVLVCKKRIEQILNVSVDVKDSNCKIKIDPTKKGQIKFENVYFKYSNASNYTLNNINFTANPGEVIAIVGPTGSGKSTLAKLISRFYDISKGKISVSGFNIKDFKLKYLRKQVGYVPQNPSLFLDTIENNITLGKEMSVDKVKNALKIAQCEDFVFKNGKNLKFNISKNAQNISGGQKQRLTIARAIAKQPSVYLFDDCFSSLDYKTQSNLMSELKKVASNSTLIIITQNISTILNADKIIVLDKGTIVGEGSHEYLINNCSVYFNLTNMYVTMEGLK